MLTPHQRRDLLRIEQSRDAAAITTAINQVLADNPDVDYDVQRDRGTKSKLIPGPHQVYRFLTTSPNAVVDRYIRTCGHPDDG